MDSSDKEKLNNKWQGTTKEAVLASVSKSGFNLRELPLEFRNDKDVVLAAVKQLHVYALEHASKGLRNDRDVVLEAVIYNGRSLQYASEELQNDREIVLEAVKSDRHVLSFVYPNFQDDLEIVSAAISLDTICGRNMYGPVLRYASPRLRSNRNIVLMAVQSHGLEIEYANPIFLNDEEIVFTAFENRRDDGSQYYGKPHTISKYILPKMWKKINEMEKKEEIENKEASTLLTDKIAEVADKMTEGLENMFMYFSDYKKEERRAEKDWMLKRVEQWQRTYKDCQEKWKNDVEGWQEKIIKWQQVQKNSQYESYARFRIEIEQMPIYQRWRQDVLKKCGNKCQMCGSSKNLEVHHRVSLYLLLKQNNISSTDQDRISRAFECKSLWDVGNGEVLCKECHDKMESSKNRQTFMSKTN